MFAAEVSLVRERDISKGKLWSAYVCMYVCMYIYANQEVSDSDL